MNQGPRREGASAPIYFGRPGNKKKGPRRTRGPSVNVFDCAKLSVEYLSVYLRVLAWHHQQVLQAPVHSLQRRPKSWAQRKWIVPARIFRTILSIGALRRANFLNRDRLGSRARRIVRKRVSQFALVLSIYVRSFCTPSNYFNHNILVALLALSTSLTAPRVAKHLGNLIDFEQWGSAPAASRPGSWRTKAREKLPKVSVGGDAWIYSPFASRGAEAV